MRTWQHAPLLASAVALALLSCADEETPEEPADVALVTDNWEVAFDATPYGAFMSVWGPSGDDVYTVGGQPQLGEDPGDGVVFHFDGESWTQLAVPEGPMLNWVHGAGESVWAVGESGRALRFEDGVFVEEFDTGVGVQLWGVWAAAEDDVWAVGGNPRDRQGAPVMAHYDGQTWSVVPTPELDRDFVTALFKVWGTRPDYAFAIGARGVILHWDGVSWEQVPSGTESDLISLWGRADDDIVAVGGRATGELGRWNGTEWSFEVLDEVSGLNGSFMAPDGTTLIDGSFGRMIEVTEGGLIDRDVPTGNVLHAVWADSASGTCFAVGGTLLAPPPFEGDVLISR